MVRETSGGGEAWGIDGYDLDGEREKDFSYGQCGERKCEQRDKEKGILKEQWLESSFCRCFGLSCVRESSGKIVESFEWQLKELVLYLPGFRGRKRRFRQTVLVAAGWFGTGRKRVRT